MFDKPMLAFPGPPDLVERLLHLDKWAAQQKVDGERALVQVRDGKVTFRNRSGGLSRCATRQMAQVFARFHTGEWVFDGEILDDTLWLFDLPEAAGRVTCSTPFGKRFAVLEGMYASVIGENDVVRLLPLARTTDEKAALRVKVRRSRGEGLVLKDLDAPYLPGKRSRYLYKDKFVQEADAVVTGVGLGISKLTNTTKANMELSVWRAGRLVKICECAAPDLDINAVKVGDVVTVQYLYVGAAGGLIQPTRPRVRTDKSPEECTWDQLVVGARDVVAV